MRASKTYTITVEGDVVLVYHSPNFILDENHLSNKWGQIIGHCQSNGASKVLISDARHVVAADAAGIFFQAAKQAAQQIPGLAIALVMSKKPDASTRDLFLTAARNRGIQLELFDNHSQAMAWLDVLALSSDSASSSRA